MNQHFTFETFDVPLVSRVAFLVVHLTARRFFFKNINLSLLHTAIKIFFPSIWRFCILHIAKQLEEKEVEYDFSTSDYISIYWHAIVNEVDNHFFPPFIKVSICMNHIHNTSLDKRVSSIDAHVPNRYMSPLSFYMENFL